MMVSRLIWSLQISLVKSHVPLRYTDSKELNPDFLFEYLRIWNEASPDISTLATGALGQEKKSNSMLKSNTRVA